VLKWCHVRFWWTFILRHRISVFGAKVEVDVKGLYFRFLSKADKMSLPTVVVVLPSPFDA